MIVSTDVTTSRNDLNELSKQIEKADETLGKPCKNVCADAGYSSVDDIKTLLDQQKTVIVPNNKQVQKEPKEDGFGKKHFPITPMQIPIPVLREKKCIQANTAMIETGSSIG